MYGRNKTSYALPLIVLVPIVVTIVFSWQIVNSTVITTRPPHVITRSESPELYWFCITVELSIIALMWVGILHIFRRRNGKHPKRRRR